MQAGDYGERRSEPWTYRSMVVPLRTYCGRVVYRHHKHYFRPEDAARIMRKLEPSQNDDGEAWAKKVINVLRHSTLAMLERILFFLPDEIISDLYDWGIGILDKLFSKISPVDQAARRRAGVSALQHIAQQSGVEITIKKP